MSNVCHTFGPLGAPRKLQTHMISITSEKVFELAPVQYGAARQRESLASVAHDLIVGSTAEQESKLGVRFQLEFHLNKRANSAHAPSSIYIAQQFLHFSYRQFIAVCLP